jgi:hypothetical protein
MSHTYFLVVEVSTCTKGSNKVVFECSGIPIPVSLTLIINSILLCASLSGLGLLDLLLWLVSPCKWLIRLLEEDRGDAEVTPGEAEAAEEGDEGGEGKATSLLV